MNVRTWRETDDEVTQVKIKSKMMKNMKCVCAGKQLIEIKELYSVTNDYVIIFENILIFRLKFHIVSIILVFIRF